MPTTAGTAALGRTPPTAPGGSAALRRTAGIGAAAVRPVLA
ncbi:hypothetical protein [Streptomyces sp. NBC_01304]|nr:hypothetical protein OG430_25110 [Streptomyces sp. NBC_01304]